MSDPTRPTAPDAAAPDVLAAIERKALSLLAGTTPGRIDVHRCDADSGAIDYQLQRAPGTPATVLGYATDSDGSSRAKADATLWAHAHEMTTAVLSLAAEVRRLTADLARLRAPAADVAAIGARHRELVAREADVRAHRGSESDGLYLLRRADAAAVASADDVPTLLALLAAEREGRAAEVAGARAAGARLRIELTATEQALDALRAERDGDAPEQPTPADREALLREGSIADLREELTQAWAETDARCRWLARLRRDLIDARAATAKAVRAEVSACAEECRKVDEAFADRGDSAAEATGARTCAIVLEGRWLTAVEASVATKGAPDV